MKSNIEILTVSVADFLAISGKDRSSFRLVGVEHTRRSRVWSGADLFPITQLEQRTKKEFLEKLPTGTLAVVSLQKNMGETPSGFFSEGVQFVSYSGTAIVEDNPETREKE